MADAETQDQCETTLLADLEERELQAQSDLKTERSFRTVWGAGLLLSFLYGLIYGVYLSK